MTLKQRKNRQKGKSTNLPQSKDFSSERLFKPVLASFLIDAPVSIPELGTIVIIKLSKVLDTFVASY
jgi:hypothetical protein